MKRLSLTSRVLISLVLGLVAGIIVAASQSPTLLAIVRAIEPIGTIWVNAIRMTVLPLVFSLLITGVAFSADMRALRGIGKRTLASYVGLLLMNGLVGLFVVPLLFAPLHIDAATTASLRASAASDMPASATVPSVAEWLVSLVPTNPFKAAADGAMLPLVVFALAFALALLHVSKDRRETVVSFFGGVGDAMLVIVRAIIELAPIGVFALMLPVASSVGAAAAGALGYYTIAISLAQFVAIALMYVVAATFGGVSLSRFARALLPAQAVAVSTSSSLASLPAMIDSAERRLELDPATTGVVLPLTVSTFKAAAPVMWPVAAIFLSKFYGVPLSFSQLAVVTITSILTSFSMPGVPHGWLLIITPLLATAGIPPQGIGMLIAVDVIPDIIATVFNVTGDMVVATIVAREAPVRVAAPKGALVEEGA
jgi:Na+/H+-dicarboxylate symporter